MLCFYCYRRQPVPGDPEGGWETRAWSFRLMQPPVCPICLDRARREHGPGWSARARGGCYAGGRPGPLLFNPPLREGETPTLDTLVAVFGKYKVRTLGDVLPGYKMVLYHPHVHPELALVFAGERAGINAVIYHDAAAHLEDRLLHEQYRLAASLPEAAIGTQSLMHRKLDDLLWAIERRLETNSLTLGDRLREIARERNGPGVYHPYTDAY